jgi:hypothetical protein
MPSSLEEIYDASKKGTFGVKKYSSTLKMEIFKSHALRFDLLGCNTM